MVAVERFERNVQLLFARDSDRDQVVVAGVRAELRGRVRHPTE